MREKLGLFFHADNQNDVKLIESLFEVMDACGTDFTNTFRNMSNITYPTSKEDLTYLNEAEN